MKWPWKFSLILLFMGLLVVFFSLQSLQSKAVAQDLEHDNHQDHENCDWHHWFDDQLPGSITYKVERGVEQVALLVERGPERATEQLVRSQKRIAGSQYAWEQGHQKDAVQTMQKAFMYLDQAASSEAALEQKTAVADHMQATIDAWCLAELSLPERTHLEQLTAQLEAVRNHHHF